MAQDRGKRRSAWSQNLEKHQAAQQKGQLTEEKNVLYEECGRRFRLQSDKIHHKCAAERRRPVCEQESAVHYEECRRWFRSRGGQAVCTGVGERREWKVVLLEVQGSPRD